MICKVIALAGLVGSLGGAAISIAYPPPPPLSSTPFTRGLAVISESRLQWCLDQTQDLADCQSAYGPQMRWLLVIVDLLIGGRYGAISAAQNAFYALQDGQRKHDRRHRFSQARDAVRTALNDPAHRRKLEDDLLDTYEGR